jgi:5'-nucleotidase
MGSIRSCAFNGVTSVIASRKLELLAFLFSESISVNRARPYNSNFQIGIGMHLLISNDDGITARGIQVLSDRMKALGRVTIVAPDQNRSGASNSLTLESPVRIRETGERTFSVSGTPTDCVHIALTGLLPKDPDMVVSGINAGANLGDDVIYSGTVAAAMEGRFLGLPAIAVSLVFKDRPRHYSTAAEAVALLVKRLSKDPLPADTILNINVPDLPWQDICGFEVTRLGHRHRAEPVVKTTDPRGKPMYWIGPAGPGQDAGPGTDFDAIRRGYISITPIHVDLTRYQALEQVSGWVSEISINKLAVPENGE